MSPIDANKILVWAQIGQQLVQIGRTEYAGLKAAMAAQGIEADTKQLELLRGLYEARIARRQQEIRDAADTA